MQYTIAPALFTRVPQFRRAVLVAHDLDNSQEHPEVLQLLRESEALARNDTLADFKNHPRLTPWMHLFSDMGVNPNRYPPSVVNLVKRVRKGTELPYVNTLVALFNCLSLRHLVPCGGDDLRAVSGDLALCFADGNESYVPLGQPEVQEQAPQGEVVYMDTGSREVFCRLWCWKNGDCSKLLSSTRDAAINVDALSPVGETQVTAMAQELQGWLEHYTGARVSLHLLTPEHPGFTVD